MNKILDFIKNCFSRFKAFLKAKFTILKKWFKHNQERFPKLIYKLVTFLIILFITFSIGTCIGSLNKNIETAYADEVYYDGDYVTIDIGNANFIAYDNDGNDFTILPSIRTLYLCFNSSINNSFDLYYPYIVSETTGNEFFDYNYVSIPFSTSVGNTYRYKYIFPSITSVDMAFYYHMNEVNNNKLPYQEVGVVSVTFELYNNSNLSSLLNTSSIRSYVFYSNNSTLVNYYGFYNNDNLLGVFYFEFLSYRIENEPDFVYGSNLYTCYNIPIFNFKSINDSAYQDGYYNGYDIGYNEGLNVGGDTSYQQGYDDGYREGHIDGEQAGYDEGYGQGYFDGSEGPLKIFETIRIGFSRLLKIEIFPNFSIGSIFLLMLSISLLFFVVRVFIK